MGTFLRSHPALTRLGWVALALSLALAAVAPSHGASADGLPSGERVNGQSTLEPVYDDMSGNIYYVSTPAHVKVHAPPVAWAPFYMIMYPNSAASSVGVMQCAHSPMDNCPDHGPLLAAAVEQMMPSVYGNGVWGHDHLLATPGSGGDFNVAWEPVAVVFTNSAAANTRITTLTQLNGVVSSGNAIEIHLPSLTFHCSVVSVAVYNHATPVTPVPGT